MDKHMYHHQKVVVGNRLNSLMYASLHKALYIQTVPAPPYLFDFFSASPPLRRWGITPTASVLYTNRGPLTVGPSHYAVWCQLMFDMSIGGRVPLSGGSTTLRLKENSVLRASLGTAKSVDIQYEDLYIFDEEHVFGLDPAQPLQQTCMVYDWYAVHQGATHNLDRILTDDAFVERLDFYPSLRVDGNLGRRKDLVAVSIFQVHFCEFLQILSNQLYL